MEEQLKATFDKLSEATKPEVLKEVHDYMHKISDAVEFQTKMLEEIESLLAQIYEKEI